MQIECDPLEQAPVFIPRSAAADLDAGSPGKDAADTASSSVIQERYLNSVATATCHTNVRLFFWPENSDSLSSYDIMTSYEVSVPCSEVHPLEQWPKPLLTICHNNHWRESLPHLTTIGSIGLTGLTCPFSSRHQMNPQRPSLATWRDFCDMCDMSTCHSKCQAPEADESAEARPKPRWEQCTQKWS